jgi:hypothetical protein
MKDLKTTISGFLVSLSTFVILSDQLKEHPLPYRIAVFILSGGLAFLGVSAKDSEG